MKNFFKFGSEKETFEAKESPFSDSLEETALTLRPHEEQKEIPFSNLAPHFEQNIN